MMEPVAFLLAKAQQLREFAGRNPEIANEVRRIAEECETAAEELRQDRRRGARA